MNKTLSVLFALLVFGGGVAAPNAFAQKPAGKNSKQEALLNTDIEFAKASVGTSALSWEPKKAEVAKSGELGWTWGTFELHTKDAEGKPVVRYGKYVNIWRKQKDGAWKVILDMGNASPAPTAP